MASIVAYEWSDRSPDKPPRSSQSCRRLATSMERGSASHKCLEMMRPRGAVTKRHLVSGGGGGRKMLQNVVNRGLGPSRPRAVPRSWMEADCGEEASD